MPGLKPIRTAGGSADSPGGLWCVLLAGRTKRAAVGDPVKLTGTSAAGYDRNGDSSATRFPQVDVTDAGETSYGVIDEIEADFTNLLDITAAAADARRVRVIIDPLQLYEIDVSGTAIVITDVGLNFNLLATEATQTGGIGKSEQTLDGTTGGGTGTAQVRLEGIQELSASTQVAVVRMIESRFSTATGVT